jgi:Ca2+:H+ antiporter
LPLYYSAQAGCSIQIAVGMIPLLVVVGWIIHQPLTLFFGNFDTIVFFVSCLVCLSTKFPAVLTLEKMVQNLLVDVSSAAARPFLLLTLFLQGKSNYLEGLMLVCLYLVIALAMFVS